MDKGRAWPDGARAKKSSTFATTLYPDAGVEINDNTSQVTRFPHPDLKLVTSGSSTFVQYLHPRAGDPAAAGSVPAFFACQ